MRLALAQIGSGTDIAGNLALIRAGIEEASARGADLVCFPEYAMYEKKRVDGSFAGIAEALDGPFAAALGDLARDHGIAVIAGMVEAHPDSGAPYNTLVGFDASGAREGAYRKTHLYDAYGFRESQWISRPDAPEHVVMSLAGMRVGVMTCYDLHFPAVAARLAADGADILAVCASWVPGPGKANQWRVLTAARAIENIIPIAAVCQTPPVSIGTSLVVDPLGTVVGELDAAPGVLCVDIDPHATARARERAAS
jgi:predicted amidohydrolase